MQNVPQQQQPLLVQPMGIKYKVHHMEPIQRTNDLGDALPRASVIKNCLHVGLRDYLIGI